MSFRHLRYLIIFLAIGGLSLVSLGACYAPRLALPTATTTARPTETAYPPSATPSPTLAPPTAAPTVTKVVVFVVRQRLVFGLVQKAMPAPTLAPTMTPTPLPTAPPSPTPTPLMPWPEPLAKPGKSRLGLHVQWNNSPEIMEFVRRMKPAVVKGVDDIGFMAEVKQVSPSTVTVARFSRNAQNTDGDPLQMARAFVAEFMPEYKRNPAVDYWEGLNEPGVRGRMAWYAAFEVERVRLMSEQGLRCAVGNFSAGVPEWEEIGEFLPAIRAAQKAKGILVLHEYDAPTMQRSVGATLPGRPHYANRGALTLRYRYWYEDYLKPRGLAIPLVISEAGVDGMIGGHPGPKGLGWQDFADYWAEAGLGRDGIRTYLDQLTWYDNEVRQDDYLLGFAVFTAGAMNQDWRTYDITALLRHIATYIIVPSAK